MKTSVALVVASLVFALLQNASAQNNNAGFQNQQNQQHQIGNRAGIQQNNGIQQNHTNRGSNSLQPQNPNNIQVSSNNRQLVQQQPQQPAWFPISAEHQKYLDDRLNFWAQESGKINHLQSNFRRWDFNPAFCNHRDSQTLQISAFRIVDGVVKYQNPDKGMYEVTTIWEFDPKKLQDPKKEYYTEVKDKEAKDQQLEKWICDGKRIFAFDFASKQLREMTLPPAMQGKGLANSPLPFLFGVQTAQLKQRYWIRPVAPQPGQIWIEVWPKRREDAQQYKFVKVIISEADYLPEAIIVFAPNYDETKNPTYMSIQFSSRKKNWNKNLQFLQIWQKEFFEPQLPYGWKHIKGKLNNAQPVDPSSPEFRAMQQKAEQGIRNP